MGKKNLSLPRLEPHEYPKPKEGNDRDHTLKQVVSEAELENLRGMVGAELAKISKIDNPDVAAARMRKYLQTNRGIQFNGFTPVLPDPDAVKSYTAVQASSSATTGPIPIMPDDLYGDLVSAMDANPAIDANVIASLEKDIAGSVNKSGHVPEQAASIIRRKIAKVISGDSKKKK